MNATHELAGDLAAIETRYAELLQELADLYQLRAQLKRATATMAGATADAEGAQPVEVVATATKRGKATGGKPALRIIAGGLSRTDGEADSAMVVNPAHRLAAQQAQQGTRAQLRLVAGGRAAS
jgi:hypothetical protein